MLDLVEQVYLILDQGVIKQKELAEKMGVSPSRISQMLNGSPDMKLTTFYRLAHALGTMEYADMTLDKRRFPACFISHHIPDGTIYEDGIIDVMGTHAGAVINPAWREREKKTSDTT